MQVTVDFTKLLATFHSDTGTVYGGAGFQTVARHGGLRDSSGKSQSAAKEVLFWGSEDCKELKLSECLEQILQGCREITEAEMKCKAATAATDP